MKNKEIFFEIEKHLLNDERPSAYFEKISNTQEFNQYPFSMIRELQGVNQNPKFHSEGNVFIHTMMVIDEGAKVRSKSIDKRIFMWALLLHDIGKKPTTKYRKGKLTSYNHDTVGANMAREFLMYFNEEETFIKNVEALVRWHMQSLFVNKDFRFQNISDMVKEVNINEIVLVCLCDRLGRGSLNDEDIKETKIQIRRFEQKIKEFLENKERTI